MSYEYPWTYNFQTVTFENLEDYVGFVYLITNLTNNKKYIGKKLLKKTKRKVVKGKKKKLLVESDWKTYWSSSNSLKKDVETLGKDKFKREILHLCTSKSQLSYLELREQVDRRVMETEDYYNEYIMVRIHKTKHLCS